MNNESPVIGDSLSEILELLCFSFTVSRDYGGHWSIWHDCSEPTHSRNFLDNRFYSNCMYTTVVDV